MNTLENTGNKADHMEERIRQLEDRRLEIIQVEEERELRSKKYWEILRQLSHTFRKCNIIIMSIPEGTRARRVQRVYIKKLQLRTSLT